MLTGSYRYRRVVSRLNSSGCLSTDAGLSLVVWWTMELMGLLVSTRPPWRHSVTSPTHSTSSVFSADIGPASRISWTGSLTLRQPPVRTPVLAYVRPTVGRPGRIQDLPRGGLGRTVASAEREPSTAGFGRSRAPDAGSGGALKPFVHVRTKEGPKVNDLVKWW